MTARGRCALRSRCARPSRTGGKSRLMHLRFASGTTAGGRMARMTQGWKAVAWSVVALAAGCAAPPAGQRAGLEKLDHIIVIYAENRSFDNLYGLFPGANGIAN